MGKIIQLDTHLSNQISAGEVVERPISVVKELVENALDAGSDKIKIEIENGGKTLITITDNGEGFSLEDLKISIDKYTTSKIKNLDDLYNVMTFGFRGEALSSISSVSKFSIITKTKENNEAYRLDYDNISGKKITTTSGENGTQICVKDLFFNTPARLNYLKTDKTEYAKILDYLYAVALSYPKVGFEFISDGKRIFKMNAGEDLKVRIYSIYGNDFIDNILDIQFSSVGIDISGYITGPKVSFPNKNRQNLFVNHRPITSPLLLKAINDAYNRFIPHGNYPGYVLNIQVDPTLVDVNVHPRKQEVRFENESNIFRSVYHAVLDKLEHSSLINNSLENIESSELSQTNSEVSNFDFTKISTNHSTNSFQEPKYYTGSGTKFKSYSPYKDISSHPNQYTIADSIDFTKTYLDSVSPQIKEENSGDLHYTKLGKIVGQTFNSYIIVEKDNKIIMFDQHALAERIIYEKLLKQETQHLSQTLLIPENIKLTSNEFSLLEEKKDIFSEMGFEIELLSNAIASIVSIPDFIKKENLKDILLGILNDISDGNILKSKTLDEVKNKIYAYTACRSAIKFGNKLNLFEMNKLLNDAIDGYSSTCPHGRPVIFEISLQDLKDKYER
ncbi:MAG: DNA mismatch repair endonuclease MutL [Candidatus Altimarinota bacterium]